MDKSCHLQTSVDQKCSFRFLGFHTYQTSGIEAILSRNGVTNGEKKASKYGTHPKIMVFICFKSFFPHGSFRNSLKKIKLIALTRLCGEKNINKN